MTAPASSAKRNAFAVAGFHPARDVETGATHGKSRITAREGGPKRDANIFQLAFKRHRPLVKPAGGVTPFRPHSRAFTLDFSGLFHEQEGPREGEPGLRMLMIRMRPQMIRQVFQRKRRVGNPRQRCLCPFQGLRRIHFLQARAGRLKEIPHVAIERLATDQQVQSKGDAAVTGNLRLAQRRKGMRKLSRQVRGAGQRVPEGMRRGKHSAGLRRKFGSLPGQSLRAEGLCPGFRECRVCHNPATANAVPSAIPEILR